ncbi:GNAT family N-acetyltransferase [Pseudoalteromonas sp. NBT06-2]|uniref:GNAT family N-acetyltransferase n=1 Tax=Pseudoalteromonas sp. NBT06-2 TaxID=2025950 RepID=UPI000BA57CA6|nr:GNAT family N-acetyltransferase [Pseudoalteromonas sp. NBT06-2]PAJ74363.1 GNAT family N-acetyltransferase [Pseudoalteromonas sp. NBT06-2]
MDTTIASNKPNEALKAIYLTAEDLNLAASLLYQAYHDDPLLMEILNSSKSSSFAYEKKLRALIREELNCFWQRHEPLVGLFKEGALKAVACVFKSDSKIKAQRMWHWRLKLMLSAGYLTTQQLIEKENTIRQALDEYDYYHFLAFIAVAPGMQKQGVGSFLLRALDDLINTDDDTLGLAVYITRDDLKPLFITDGFKSIKKLEFCNISGDLLFKLKASI